MATGADFMVIGISRQLFLEVRWTRIPAWNPQNTPVAFTTAAMAANANFVGLVTGSLKCVDRSSPRYGLIASVLGLACIYAPSGRVRQLPNAPQWGVSLDAAQAARLKRFGINLRRERMRRGLTQERLAELVSLNPRTIQKIEAGRLNVLITTVWRLRDALKCSWEILMKSGGAVRGEG